MQKLFMTTGGCDERRLFLIPAEMQNVPEDSGRRRLREEEKKQTRIKTTGTDQESSPLILDWLPNTATSQGTA